VTQEGIVVLRGWLVAAGVLRAFVSVACADELVFKNGDRKKHDIKT
jgi:hypothetical protein